MMRFLIVWGRQSGKSLFQRWVQQESAATEPTTYEDFLNSMKKYKEYRASQVEDE